FLIDPENKIGYVRLTSFSRHSAEELKEAIDQLQKRGMKALVLDLRFNPGGLLSQAVEIADMFLEEGTIVSTKGRNTEPEVRSAEERGTYPDFPMVVLVNRYSASASEIVSAALQDHERALVCGERTWGKGSVQNVIQLGDGDSALKLTTASYHRPSGKNIHRFPDMKEEDEWGVLPDEGYLIKLKSEEMRDYLNYRRDRDVISANGPPKSDYKDQHLDKALEYLRGELGAESKDESKSDPDADQPKAVPADDPNADLSSRLRLRLPSVLAM
ncbi:MAG: S41 family peptidase, partial [Planctomycetaceae bacterium]